jgi:CRISPR-associated endonuclease/helicase Cas3
MNKLPDKLLAKSKREGRDIVTLEEHLSDTETVAVNLFDLKKRLGKNWCRFFKISTPEQQEIFLLNLRIAALFHDIGKANEDFYNAVDGKESKQQTLRHEHLSALILCLPTVRNWLAQNSDLDLDIITGAVLSHHLKACNDDKTSPNGENYEWGQPKNTNRTKIKLYLIHPEVTTILRRIEQVANLHSHSLPELSHKEWSESDSIWDKALADGFSAASKLKKSIAKNENRKLLLAAVKAGLIAADGVASGLVREGKEIKDWIEEVVHSENITADEIAREIIYPRLEQIIAKEEKREPKLDVFRGEYNTPEKLEQLRDKKVKPFQQQLSSQSHRTLLLAGCGVGKTLAAWIWAEAQAKKYQVSKVVFLYPTRGTALEGFKDYVSWAPEADAALVTGTARYELEAMRENPEGGERAHKNYRTEAEERLFAFGFWPKRFFSATVDQFLSFMEHGYQSICLLPALADSIVIIDEVHSFDRSMFDNLISFLHHFDIPVLCMTATLPKSRREELVNAGLSVYPTEKDRVELPDLTNLEETERYRLHQIDGFNSAYQKAIEAYREGKRVLWVVNTVDRCIAIAKKLEHEESINAITYHSRFTLFDRQKVHSLTIEAFSSKREESKDGVIAITTQVCEMSLDLDADVLITEIAPISSLVQRFGRANRHLFRPFADIYIYRLPDKLIKPYDKDELLKSKEFLDSLKNGEISQHRLAQGLEDFARREPQSDLTAKFLNSGYFAIPGSFRDESEYTVPCILNCDLKVVEKIMDRKSKEKYRKEQYIIQVPKKLEYFNNKPAWMPKYLGIAPSEPEQYSENRGFMTKDWQKVELG